MYASSAFLNSPERQQRLLRSYQKRLGEPSAPMRRFLEEGWGNRSAFSASDIEQLYSIEPSQLQALLDRQFLQEMTLPNGETQYTLHESVLAECLAAPAFHFWKVAAISAATLALSLGVWMLVARPTSQPATIVQTKETPTLAPSTAQQALWVQRELYRSIPHNATPQQLDQLIHQYELKVDKSPVEAWFALALLHESKGESDAQRTVECYSEVLKCDPQFVPAYCGRARAYLLLRQYDASLEDYQRALNVDRTCEVAYHGRAEVYQQQAQYEQALAEYSKALQVNSDNEWTWKYRADIYTLLKQYDKAVKDYSKALQINPYSDAIWNARGNAYALLQDYAHAVADYDKALALQPQADYIAANKKKVAQLAASQPQLAQTSVPPTTDEMPPLAPSIGKDQHLPTETLLREEPKLDAQEPVAETNPSTNPLENTKEWAVLQKMHPELHRFVGLLGRWEKEKEGQAEEWRLAGYQQLKNSGSEESFSIEYLSDQQRLVLYWQWGDQANKLAYGLVSSENGQWVFRQTESEEYPEKIAFQMRPTGGYSIFIQNRKEFSKKQQQWLKQHYQLLHNREAMRKVKPAAKGRL